MLPPYLAKAVPNPLRNRAPWYANTAPTYAGIFLWIAFYQQMAGGTLQHVFQNAEFLGGKVDRFGAADDLAANAVQCEFGHLQTLGGGLAATQQCAYTRQKFDESEGLYQVVVGALFQAFDAIVQGAARAEDEHRGTNFAIADFFEDLQAVHIGQHAVQNHQIIIGSVNTLKCGASRKGGIHRISGAFEAPAEEVSDALLVLDN